MEYPLSQLESAQFPPLLSQIPHPPRQLYVRGTLPSYELKWLTVVGSRKYSSYGKLACEHLVRGLRGAPVVIVSGLALGIDAIAHRAALDAGLPCVAVPGSGLDWKHLYPRSNHSLARAILESGGALLSEYDPDEAAAPWTFPQRNRIMAGMAHATLLIEAGEKSGTLITARLAVDYNRELMAVPGSIFSEGAKGAHQFLQLGARLISSPEDILDCLGLETKQKPLALGENLTEHERKIVDVLAVEPHTRDHLISTIELNAVETAIALTTLEMKGMIVEEFGILRRVC